MWSSARFAIVFSLLIGGNAFAADPTGLWLTASGDARVRV